jgi:hypothetical protein
VFQPSTRTVGQQKRVHVCKDAAQDGGSLFLRGECGRIELLEHAGQTARRVAVIVVIVVRGGRVAERRRWWRRSRGGRGRRISSRGFRHHGRIGIDQLANNEVVLVRVNVRRQLGPVLPRLVGCEMKKEKSISSLFDNTGKKKPTEREPL